MTEPMTVAEVRALPVVVVDMKTAARAFGINKDTAYRLYADGELPVRALRVGRKIRVRRSDLLSSLGLDDAA